MDRLRTKTVDAEKYGESGRKVYGGYKKKPSEPMAEFDAVGTTQAAIERLPLVVATDRWLQTQPESDESIAALGEVLEMVRG